MDAIAQAQALQLKNEMLAKQKSQIRFTEEQRVELDSFYKKYSDQAEGLKNSNPGLCELSCKLRLSKKQIKTYCRNKKYFEVEKEKKMTENAMKIKQAFGTVGQDVDIEDSKVISNLISSRFKWTPKMHDIFLKAIDNLKEEATPSRILSYIKQAAVKGEFEPGIDISNLNRFHVTSHLQQFRNNQRKNLMSLGSDRESGLSCGTEKAISFGLQSISSCLRMKEEDLPSKNTISTQTSDDPAASALNAAHLQQQGVNVAASNPNVNSAVANSAAPTGGAMTSYPNMAGHGMQYMGFSPYGHQPHGGHQHVHNQHQHQQHQHHQQQHAQMQYLHQQQQQHHQNQMMMPKSIFNMPTNPNGTAAATGDNHMVNMNGAAAANGGNEFAAANQFQRPGFYQHNFMKPQELQTVNNVGTTIASVGVNGIGLKEEVTSLDQHDFHRDDVITEPISSLQDHIFGMLDQFNGKVLAVFNPEDIEIVQNENGDEVSAVIKDAKFLTCLKNLQRMQVRKRKA